MVRYLWSLKDYWSRKGQPYSYLPFGAWQFHGLTEEISNMICCWTALLSVGCGNRHVVSTASSICLAGVASGGEDGDCVE